MALQAPDRSGTYKERYVATSGACTSREWLFCCPGAETLRLTRVQAERRAALRVVVAQVAITLGVMGFDPISKRMRVESLHPGVTREDIFANTGFEMLFAEEGEETPEPTQQ